MPADSRIPQLVALGALVTSEERGLAADLLAARACGAIAHPVCTAIVAAGHGRVTDVIHVPEDAVAAQLEHLEATLGPLPIKASALVGHGVLERLAAAAEAGARPLVLDLRLRGAHGEELLTPRGREALLERLGMADLVFASREDADTLTGVRLASLDDAQVAAQRLLARGARAVVLRCGPLPARFFETDQELPPSEEPLNADLYYDGRDFALFEAPQLPEGPPGAAEAFAMSSLVHLVRGRAPAEALQEAKRFVTEALRRRSAPEAPLAYFWEAAAPPIRS